MIVKAPLHSGYKAAMLRARGWHLRGLGQAGRVTGSGGATTRTGGLTTTTATGPASGTAHLVSLIQRQAQAAAPQTPANTPVVVTRQPLPTVPAPTPTTPASPTKTPLTCPSGSVLDFYGESCVAAPITATTTQGVNVVTAATAIPSCPTGQTYDPNTGLCDICPSGQTYDSSTGLCVTQTNYLPWILGGVGIVLLFALMSKK